MPTKPPRVGGLTPKRVRWDDSNRTTTQRGYGADWQRVRNAYIAEHPLCCDPMQLHTDRVVPADDVDHIIPLSEGGERLAWSNLRSVCRACHVRVTHGKKNG